MGGITPDNNALEPQGQPYIMVGNQLDDEPTLYAGNGWKSPHQTSILNWWALGRKSCDSPTGIITPEGKDHGRALQLYRSLNLREGRLERRITKTS